MTEYEYGKWLISDYARLSHLAHNISLRDICGRDIIMNFHPSGKTDKDGMPLDQLSFRYLYKKYTDRPEFFNEIKLEPSHYIASFACSHMEPTIVHLNLIHNKILILAVNLDYPYTKELRRRLYKKDTWEWLTGWVYSEHKPYIEYRPDYKAVEGLILKAVKQLIEEIEKEELTIKE